MAKFLVKNSGPLKGEVYISGSKNAVLPIMAATLLCEEKCEITDAPRLRDVDVMCNMLRRIGAEVIEDYDGNRLYIGTKVISDKEAPYALVSKMRASVLVMGPILARTGRVRMPLPGGCAIGARPIDLHLKGFAALGARIEEGKGYVEAVADKLQGCNLYLDFPSVGATENIIMAAVLAEGTSVIENVAQEPEIVDLANFLNKMGAKIKGAGTDTIKIEGVKKLNAVCHSVIPDRIETGTFMVAAAITRGNILLRNALPDHVKPIIAKLKECGVEIYDTFDGLIVNAENAKLVATDIKTLPYPGFPTDMQSIFMAFLTTIDGESNVHETVFENRFMHVAELERMGADIVTEDRRAIIKGGKPLKGTSVFATDLRAGAAMVLAGFVAEGETEVSEIYHIERGYERFIDKLKALGGSIERVEEKVKEV
ncbi:MAG: UDP-N-acetylglucosamine 1-carboxyvinyltransferase [Eubacteriales bacterium]|nr:UDP-N-acetylglucosamine 1-carboxyvinyltransferase [Eubacteriales bacterium]MDD4390659.1 UDP-N-acetylglucosamine 1-carboxyvinyltransferase [Eubacteriales bacterium]